MKKNDLVQAFSKIAKAYVFLHLNFNLNLGVSTLNLIPSWLGYLWISESIQVLKIKQKTLSLLEPLCTVLRIYHTTIWIFNALGITFHSDIVSLLSTVISLYFHFQFLTDLAQIATDLSCTNTEKLLQLRTVRTILLTIPALPIPWSQIQWSIILISVIHMTVVIMTCSALYTLKHEIMEKEFPDILI